MLEKITNTIYFFPIRLLSNHIKENLILSLSWIFILFIIIGKLGDNYGVPMLFLNPEYIGVVGYFSFQLVGICFGIFYITWNLVSYLLYSYRYPFVASLRWPFAMFTFNNSIIPLAFFIAYLFQVVDYQNYDMGRNSLQIFWMVLGLLGGFALVLLITSVYFVASNKDIFGFIDPSGEHEKNNTDYQNWDDLSGQGKADRVDYYLSRKFRLRHVRDVTHYDDGLLLKVFQQHHLNAFLIIILNAAILIGSGLLIDKPLFEIPAAGTIFLFFSIVISLAGLVYYWGGKWGSVVVILLILGLNSFSKLEWMQRNSQAYGLNYETKQEYSLEVLDSLCQGKYVERDIIETLEILNKWKEKNKEGKPYYYKPKLMIVLATGGGSRSATFTMKVIQTLDSLSNGEVMKHTALMSGASGGMMGLAYYRELYLRNQLGLAENIQSEEYTRKISLDLINKITTTIVANDLFFGFRKYYYGDKVYNFDRGTSFELSLNEHTDGILNKSLADYKSFEKSASIPLMFISTINVNDMRKMIISPQPVSYMMRAYSEFAPEHNKMYEVDAIDFGAFFSKNDAYNLSISSAIRMNATYPLILPNVSLPSTPQIDVFDAGIRDNFGMENALRFLNVFQDWIKTNTSGVVIVQIRDNVKKNKIEDFEYKTFLSKLGSSFGSISSNLTINQDYVQDYILNGTDDVLKGKIEVVNFEYVAAPEEKRASMSLRLSEQEYYQLTKSALNENNLASYKRVLELLNQ
ncbi:MAG: hypothetical protein H6579_01460 [Chitinophagales bacterium]|nr:hypothetical protein [Chitinophagales bacterium]